MTKKLYSCRDEVARIWNEPFPDFNDGSALRSFVDFVRANSSKQSTVRDLSLYCIGEFDTVTGSVCGSTPVLVASALSILNEVTNHE